MSFVWKKGNISAYENWYQFFVLQSLVEQKVYLFFQKELILIEIVEKAWYKQNSKHTFTCNLLHSMNTWQWIQK